MNKDLEKTKEILGAFLGINFKFDNISFILNAFALYFLQLKEAKEFKSNDYRVIKELWKSLEIYPVMNEKGEICFKEWKKKKVNKNAEKDLINDILWDFQGEVIGIMKFFN